MTNKAQVIYKLGAPSVMQWEVRNVPELKAGEIRLRHTAIGVNFADTYHRSGISHPWIVPDPPVKTVAKAVAVSIRADAKMQVLKDTL